MFKIHSPYQPSGDQPVAIKQLTAGIEAGKKFQTLLGVTGSGKTFTMANVIANTQKPTLVMAHNKTLAAQLCHEFREFFPENAVEYFVSYYDYYQPEAYMPRTDTYIEKESQVNEEIDRLRHAATQALLSRRDVIIVASVSCIYSIGSPKEYENSLLRLTVGQGDRTAILHELIRLQFQRSNADLKRGYFRVKGQILEIMPMDREIVYRVGLGSLGVDRIDVLDPITRRLQETTHDAWIFPAKHFMTAPGQLKVAQASIAAELKKRLKQFDQEGKILEAERLSRRTHYDLEMIKNVGYCNGIENYSSHFDGRAPGEPPFALLDYFPKDYLMIIDESHVTVPQIRGMYAGDRARKESLVEHGFRLPSAKDNRPLQFEEFEERIGQVIFTSATPSDYELEHSDGVVEQIIRPTGLVDPQVDIRPVTPVDDRLGQVDDLISEIKARVPHDERVLVTTLTKKMAEDLTGFLVEEGIKVNYLHSDIQTLDRITILTEFRQGVYDVIVGVNLLREGLDLPEVTLVAILDADKEGFLRSDTALIQTIGRAARNTKGQVILYADHVTGSMKRALDETGRRRKKQIAYNKTHGITPVTVTRDTRDIRGMLSGEQDARIEDILALELTAEPHELETVIKEKTYDMKQAAQKLDFETATLLRDEIAVLEKELKNKKSPKAIARGDTSASE